MTKLPPIHPGEILKEEYMVQLGMSAAAFAKVIGVPTSRVTRIINGACAISADSAMRLAKALRTTPAFWMNLQSRYDLLIAQENAPTFERIKPVIAA